MKQHKFIGLLLASLILPLLLWACDPDEDDDTSTKSADFTLAATKGYFPAAGGAFDVGVLVKDNKTKGTGAITYKITSPASGSRNAGTKITAATGKGMVHSADKDKTIVVTVTKAKSNGFTAKSKTVSLVKAAIMQTALTVDNSGSSKAIIKLTTDQNGKVVEASSGSIKSTFTVAVTAMSPAVATDNVSVASVAVNNKVISITLNKALKATDMVTLAYTGKATNYIQKNGSAAGANKLPNFPALMATNGIIGVTAGTYNTTSNILELEGANLDKITAAMIGNLEFVVGDNITLNAGDYTVDSPATSTTGTDVSAHGKWRYKADGTKVWIKIDSTDAGTLEGEDTNNYAKVANGTKVADNDGLTLAAANASMQGLKEPDTEDLLITIASPALTSGSFAVATGILTIAGANLPGSDADLTKLSFDVTGATPSTPVKYQFKAATETHTAIAYTSAPASWAVTLSGVEQVKAELALATAANRHLVSEAQWGGSNIGIIDHSNDVTLVGSPMAPSSDGGTITVSIAINNAIILKYVAARTAIINALTNTNPTYIKAFVIGQGVTTWTEAIAASATGTANRFVYSGMNGTFVSRANGAANITATSSTMSTGAQDLTNGAAVVAIIACSEAIGNSGAGNYTLAVDRLTLDDTTNCAIQYKDVTVSSQS